MNSSLRANRAAAMGSLALLIVAGAVTPAGAQVSMLDPSFGTNGTLRYAISGGAAIDDRAAGLALQGDGKIVMAGYSVDSTGHRAFAVARFDTNGTPDAGFGTNGSVRFYIHGGNNSDDEGEAVLIQSDNKIVVAGFSYISMTTGVAFAVARLNSNGTLDGSFGGGTGTAYVLIGASGGLTESYSLVLQNGKIVLGGYCESPPLKYTFALARFNANGTLDGGFGSLGTVRSSVSNTNRDIADALALESDGKFLLAGTNGGLFAIERFDSTGKVDSSFATNGSTLTNVSSGDGSNGTAHGIGIQANGRIVLSGVARDTSGKFGFAVARYLASGQVDTTFGWHGSEITFIGGGTGGTASGSRLAVQKDGKIVVGGTSYDSLSHGDFAVARYDSDGSLDNTFGTGGTTRNPIAGGTAFTDGAGSVAIQADGRIIASGTSADATNHTLFALARYLAHNTLVSVSTPGPALPSRFALDQNYPNPFNPATAIRYEIPVAAAIRLTVYNILGQSVAVLVNGRQDAGRYQVRFDATGLASGVYVYRIEAGQYAAVKKLMILR